MANPNLSDDARGHLERYLRRVKLGLRGHPSVDAGEVERDVRGHIEAELAGLPEPVGVANLRLVLDRLGTPETWIPSDDLPAWRRVLSRLRSGPEEWRLAYLTLAMFMTGVGLFFGGLFLWPLEPLLIVASVLTGRAALAVLAEHDEPVGARRWLIYPPLVPAYALLAIVLIGWPLGPAAGAITDTPFITQAIEALRPEAFWIVAPACIAFVVGVWWMVLGLLLRPFHEAVRVAFSPFADRFDRRHGAWIACAGLLLALTSGGVLSVAIGWW